MNFVSKFLEKNRLIFSLFKKRKRCLGFKGDLDNMMSDGKPCQIHWIYAYGFDLELILHIRFHHYLKMSIYNINVSWKIMTFLLLGAYKKLYKVLLTLSHFYKRCFLIRPQWLQVLFFRPTICCLSHKKSAEFCEPKQE